MTFESGLYWYLGIMGALLACAVAYQFTPASRLRRRRRKSHSHIETKVRRPMVRFSVRPPDEKR